MTPQSLVYQVSMLYQCPCSLGNRRYSIMPSWSNQTILYHPKSRPHRVTTTPRWPTTNQPPQSPVLSLTLLLLPLRMLLALHPMLERSQTSRERRSSEASEPQSKKTLTPSSTSPRARNTGTPTSGSCESTSSSASSSE